MATRTDTTRPSQALIAIITAAAIGCTPIIAAVLASSQVLR